MAFRVVILFAAAGALLASLSGSSHLAAGQEGKPVAKLWAQQEDRGSTRLIYFHETSPTPWDSSPGQVAIEYGKAVWKPEYAEKFDALTLGKRWRLGQNLWTNLDTRLPIQLGSVKVPPGYYYLALDRADTGEWRLALLDPDKLAQMRLDAWHVDKKPTPKGILAPLSWAKVEESADKLQIEFHKESEESNTRATLEIRFGPHRLTVPVKVRLQ